MSLQWPIRLSSASHDSLALAPTTCPLAHCTLATLASLLFLENVWQVPISGLHILLFPLPKRFPQASACLPPSLPQVFTPVTFLWKPSLTNLFKNYTAPSSGSGSLCILFLCSRSSTRREVLDWYTDCRMPSTYTHAWHTAGAQNIYVERIFSKYRVPMTGAN